MFKNYPELYMTDLNVRIMNDLTFNLKKTRGEEFGWLGSNIADKECQTEVGQPGQVRQELGSHHGGSGVKFVFDCEGSSLKSPNLSTKSFTMGNGVERTNKTILKKHPSSIHENMISSNLERSLSLTDSSIPLLEKKQSFVCFLRERSHCQETRRGTGKEMELCTPRSERVSSLSSQEPNI